MSKRNNQQSQSRARKRKLQRPSSEDMKRIMRYRKMYDMFNEMTGNELIKYNEEHPKMSSTDRLAFDHVCNELVTTAQSLTEEQQAEVLNEINGTDISNEQPSEEPQGLGS